MTWERAAAAMHDLPAVGALQGAVWSWTACLALRRGGFDSADQPRLSVTGACAARGPNPRLNMHFCPAFLCCCYIPCVCGILLHVHRGSGTPSSAAADNSSGSSHCSRQQRRRHLQYCQRRQTPQRCFSTPPRQSADALSLNAI